MGKTVPIKETKTDETVEQQAIDSRRSVPKRKSDRGLRTARITALVPESLYNEVRLLAKVKDRSIGDMINEFLEDQVRANREDIEALKRINDRNAQD